ncbi:MAG: hypothetical protein EZS28_011928, partial [Streblomastix strix]
SNTLSIATSATGARRREEKMLEESPAISLSVPNDLQTLTQNVEIRRTSIEDAIERQTEQTYEDHTLIKWSRVPIDAVLHDEAELIEQNENKDGLNKQNSLAGSLGGILNGYDGEEAGFGLRYVVKLEDMGFFIQCEAVPEKAPTEVSTMADIISKDAQQQQQQVDANKTKIPEIKPPQIVTLQPGSQTNKGFGTSSSQQRVTTTSGSGKTRGVFLRKKVHFSAESKN